MLPFRNATKFTPEGGKVKIVTKLLWPKLPRSCSGSERQAMIEADLPPTPATAGLENGKECSGNKLSSNLLYAHDLAGAAFENVVVRVEIHE